MTDECVLMAFRCNQYVSESAELEHKRGETWRRWAEWMREDFKWQATCTCVCVCTQEVSVFGAVGTFSWSGGLEKTLPEWNASFINASTVKNMENSYLGNKPINLSVYPPLFLLYICSFNNFNIHHLIHLIIHSSLCSFSKSIILFIHYSEKKIN